MKFNLNENIKIKFLSISLYSIFYLQLRTCVKYKERKI